MNSLRNQLHQRATNLKQTIVLPESSSLRILIAAEVITQSNMAKVILPGKEDDLNHLAEKVRVSLDGITVINPSNIKSRNRKSSDYGATLVQQGFADGCICGAKTSTAEVVRSALDIIGSKNDVPVTSSFVMVSPDHEKVFVFSDAGVIIDPDADTLVHIAKASSDTYRNITGGEPHVAFLSFSTKGSADHTSVDKMKQASQQFKALYPEIPSDGEMQFDAAVDLTVAAEKIKDSPVAGKANVLVFPDLNSANIAYKVAERLGGYQALGPILQGLNKPMMDLSRGCEVDDIVDMAAICSLMKS